MAQTGQGHQDNATHQSPTATSARWVHGLPKTHPGPAPLAEDAEGALVPEPASAVQYRSIRGPRRPPEGAEISPRERSQHRTHRRAPAPASRPPRTKDDPRTSSAGEARAGSTTRCGQPTKTHTGVLRPAGRPAQNRRNKHPATNQLLQTPRPAAGHRGGTPTLDNRCHPIVPPEAPDFCETKEVGRDARRGLPSLPQFSRGGKREDHHCKRRVGETGAVDVLTGPTVWPIESKVWAYISDSSPCASGIVEGCRALEGQGTLEAKSGALGEFSRRAPRRGASGLPGSVGGKGVLRKGRDSRGRERWTVDWSDYCTLRYRRFAPATA